MMPALLLMALTLGLVSPATSADVPPLVARQAATVVSERIGGQTAVVATPRVPTRRVVVVAHGYGHDAWTMLANVRALAAPLLAHGYTIVTSDAHGNAWGNRASRRDYVEVARTMRRRGLDRVYVLAGSMGGLATLRAMRRIHPVAWAGLYPACNLASLSPFRFRISRAYGLPWWRVAALRRMSPIHPHGVAGMPMIFWASPEDTVVPKALNTDLCAAAARRAGARVTVVTTRGEHGDPSNFQPQRLVAFFDAAGDHGDAPAPGARARR